jgi:hypothetical protein
MEQIVACKFHHKKTMSEWVFAPQAFLTYATARTSYIHGNDDDVIRYVYWANTLNRTFTVLDTRRNESTLTYTTEVSFKE